MRTVLACGICCCLALAVPALLTAQARNPPLEFKEFQGTWTLDEAATQELRTNRGSAGGLIDRIGFRAARTLVIATTPVAISVVNDGLSPEVYQIDGTDTPVRDERTGVSLSIRHRFTFVAGMLALTRTESRGAPPQEGATIITDAYRVDGDVLSIERQHSVLYRPEGYLATLANQPRRSTLVYRRAGR